VVTKQGSDPEVDAVANKETDKTGRQTRRRAVGACAFGMIGSEVFMHGSVTLVLLAGGGAYAYGGTYM